MDSAPFKRCMDTYGAALDTNVYVLQALIENIVTEYYPRLESVSYVDTFRLLKTRCASWVVFEATCAEAPRAALCPHQH